MPGVFSTKMAPLKQGAGDSAGERADNANGAALVAASVVETEEGAIYGASTVLGFDGADAVVEDFLFRDEGTPDALTSATISEFDFNPTCDLRRPIDGETVMGVRLASASQPTDVVAHDRWQIAEKLLSGLQVSTNFRRPIRLGEVEERKLGYTQLGQFDGSMKAVDVLLTDTSKPVYLVLQTRGGRIIWNLHLAPGVKLAHVAMISQGKVGLSGLPDGTTYEALRICDFAGPHFFGADDEPRDCMIRSWRKPQPNWIAWQLAQRGPGLFANMIETFTKGHAAYALWYQGAFGVSASTNTVAAYSAGHVLLWPVPDEKFLYRPITGKDLAVIKSDYLIVGDLPMRSTRVTQLHRDLMQAALGCNLDTLWPPAMEGNVK